MTELPESLAAQSYALEKGATTATELAMTALRRAEKCRSLNAFVALDPAIVLSQAQASDDRRNRDCALSPLDGLPIAIKDNYLTRDYPTTACSNARPLEHSGIDAEIIANLRTAGAIIFGKTNMHEWAFGATNTISCFGPSLNPHNPSHITGGSSGGSAAAVAAGIVHAALGSDTGGSVRIPASACGVFGFKPTTGRASCQGILPLSQSLDTPGLLTTSLDDIELLLPLLFTPDEGSTSNCQMPQSVEWERDQPIRLLNITGERLERSDEVESAMLQTLNKARTPHRNLALKGFKNYFAAWQTILLYEAALYHRQLYTKCASKYSSSVRSSLEAGARLSKTEIARAYQLKERFSRYLLSEIDEWDALVLPTLPVTLPLIGEMWQEFGGVQTSTQNSMTWFCWIGNLARLPCLTIPVTNSKNNLPIGIMLMGKPGHDERLLTIAKQILSSLGAP
ncbi:amidase [uncultured Sneathiella sp.]|uniref:amidase n=1 Tax=uncultured Sneathiella sp. TaxID=879315 RepID=UPI0030EEA96A|tara:strand:+ start:50192 stop:51550 length:1359 start_codon:yes stop_codon:yes gene_type:complete